MRETTPSVTPRIRGNEMEYQIDRLLYYILGTLTCGGLGGAILGLRIRIARQGSFGTVDILIGAGLLCGALYYAVMTVLEYQYRYGEQRPRRSRRRRR